MVAEDDIGLNQGIRLALQREEFIFDMAYTLKETWEKWRKENPDMVILDVNFPDGNGFDFLRMLRQSSDIPVIVVTANDMETDEVTGLTLGADDYITKPFSLMVLMSKVNALMRRIGEKDGDVAGQFLRSGDLEVNCREMKAYKGGEEIFLSKRELQLLLYFMENPRQIISKEQILSGVWDVDGQFVDDNTVPVTISRLKKKAAGSGRAEYIKNVRGMGYIWTEDVTGI